jgi:hypothetical protein
VSSERRRKSIKLTNEAFGTATGDWDICKRSKTVPTEWVCIRQPRSFFNRGIPCKLNHERALNRPEGWLRRITEKLPYNKHLPFLQHILKPFRCSRRELTILMVSLKKQEQIYSRHKKKARNGKTVENRRTITPTSTSSRTRSVC